jgi:pyruvate,water dikinase
MTRDDAVVRWFDTLGSGDVASVGGKNASLGEMIRTLGADGIRVPDGFATTAHAYRMFLRANGLEEPISALLDDMHAGTRELGEVGAAIREMILSATFPDAIAAEIRSHYLELSHRYGRDEVDVAVRSSATAEDLPTASFAGQHESFLNICGEDALLAACRDCYASLFNDRAISYREAQGFEHMKVALSIGVQKMIRSDKAGAGVMFTIDTESGFPDVTVINGAWGLGESVVKGSVTPDEYIVYTPLLDREGGSPIIGKELGGKAIKLVYGQDGQETTEVRDTTPEERAAWVLSDDEVVQLARWGQAIERHYGTEMDVEWARDGDTGELYIVQARPETVVSRRVATSMKAYRLKEEGEVLVEGISIGSAIATGQAQVIMHASERERFRDGAILVTGQTDPDWVPIMKRAAGIVTDHGGRTSHAAIVSRELGVPAIVGTGNATSILKDGQEITLSCTSGDEGQVFAGALEYDVTEMDLKDLPTPETRIMINMANPATAFRWWQLPTRGIGLARMEFIISHSIRIHPMALVRFDALQDEDARRQIEELTRGYADKTEYFVEKLALGMARLAAPHYPDPVIVRMSDFKTNEYASLIGGAAFEPVEANPMLGFRGASRYYDERYREGFALECRAIKWVREHIGLDNVAVMIPFCRTLTEADHVLAVMAEQGLRRGDHGLQVYVMAEIPSNVILAREFADRFDGFSIGSNDLTQLVLGVDRDSGDLTQLFDERDEAVKRMIAMLIPAAHDGGATVGICGEAPSNYPEFAQFLVEQGIDSISLSPDRVVETLPRIVEAEKRLMIPAGADRWC